MFTVIQSLTAQGWKQAELYAAEGISFGWHNHDFEFVALLDGAIPMDILLAEAPDIKWETPLWRAEL